MWLTQHSTKIFSVVELKNIQDTAPEFDVDGLL